MLGSIGVGIEVNWLIEMRNNMWRWTIGIVLAIGLCVPMIALATDSAQPPVPTPVNQDVYPSQARMGQPRLAFNEQAKMIQFDSYRPFVSTTIFTDVVDVVDIALDPFDMVWGAIDKQGKAMVWYRFGVGNRQSGYYLDEEYCSNVAVRTLSLSRSQAGCILAEASQYLYVYANPALFVDLSTYPTSNDYVYNHAIESEWGSEHGLVLTEDGTLWPVGYNTFGQASVLAPLLVGPWPRSFDAGYVHSIAARSDGSVVVWGGESYNGNSDLDCVRAVPVSATNIIKVVAGARHNLALRADGTVVGWGGAGASCVQGAYSYPAEANVPSGLTNIVDIAAGDGVSAALKADGTVYVWGSRCVAPTNNQPLPPCTLASKLSGIVKIQVASLGVGLVHVLAISANPIVRSVTRCVGNTTPCTADATLPISGGRIMVTGEYLRNTLVMLDNKTIPANMITYDSNNTMYVSLPAHVSGSANLVIMGSNGVPVNVTVRYNDAIPTLTNTRTVTISRTASRTATVTKINSSPTSKSNSGLNTTTTASRTATMTRTATRTRTATMTRTATRTRTATMTRSSTRTPKTVP